MASSTKGETSKKIRLNNDDDVPSPSTTTKKLDIKTVSNLLNICAGTFEIEKGKKGILAVELELMDVMDVEPVDYAYLDEFLEPAYFGGNKKKITDPTVRKSKHTKDFDSNLDIQSILESINVKGFIQPYELNFYQQGDFFLLHRDTNPPGLIGTLMIILPTECVGGDLCFGDYNIEAVMDKSKLRFIYFNGELEHSVSKVLSGKRISLVWNVFDPSHCPRREIRRRIKFSPVKPTKIDVFLSRGALPNIIELYE